MLVELLIGGAVVLAGPSAVDGVECMVGAAGTRAAAGPERGLHAPHRPMQPQTGGVTVWVNFAGGELSYEPQDDATRDVSAMKFGEAVLTGAFPAYGEGAQQEAVWQALLEDWDGRGVTLTRERPRQGSYTAAWVGPSDFPARAGNPTGVGIADTDCGNTNPNNVAFAFFDAASPQTAPQQAKTITHEIGHTLGLDHSSFDGAIMESGHRHPNPAFVDQCVPLRVQSNCPVHQKFCGQGQQNEAAEVGFIVAGADPGPDSGDVVSFLSPSDGAVLKAGAPVRVAVAVAGAESLSELVLSANGTDLQRWDAPPFSAELTLPEGPVVLAAAATWSDGVTEHGEIRVTVGAGAPGGSGDQGDGVTGGSITGGGWTDGGTADGAATGTGGGSCSAAAAPTARWIGLAVLVGWWRRRKLVSGVLG